MSFISQVASLIYRNIFLNRSVFYFIYLLIIIIVLNLLKSNISIFWSATIFLMLLGFLQQYFYTFSMVEDRASGFKTTFKIMGLSKNAYFFGQLISFGLTSAGVLVIILAASLLERFTKTENKIEMWIYFVFVLVGMMYMMVLSSMSMLISYPFKKSATARAFTIAIFWGLLTISLVKVFENGRGLAWWLNPNHLYLEFVLTLWLRISELDVTYLFFLFGLQFIIYTTLALYLEHVTSSGGDDHGKPWLFFLKRNLRTDQHPPLLGQEQEDIDHTKLQLRNVTKKFGNFVALNNVSADMDLGKIHCILGHNGAGKSTLINVMTGIYKATSGVMMYKGFDLIRLFQEENQSLRVGICQAENILFDNMTVYQHFRMMTLIRGSFFAEEEIWQILVELGLQNYVDFNVSQLSGGNKRKVNIGLSLIGSPNVLFFDEPTSALDPVSRKEIWRILLNIKSKSEGKIVLMTTHHLEEAETVADDIVFLSEGTVRVQGKIEDLKKLFGIGYLIQIKSRIDQPKMYFESVLATFQETLGRTIYQPKNISISPRKVEIKIPLSEVSRVREIVEAIRREFPPNLQISLSTNTLERAYLEIERQIHENQPQVSEEQLPPILDSLYKPENSIILQPFKAIIFIARNKLRYLTQNTFEFIKVLAQYIFICSVIAFVIIYVERREIRMTADGVYSIFFSFLVIEMIISTFTVHNLVYEHVRSIKHTLFVNKVSPLSYFLGKLVGGIFVTGIIYAIIFPLSYFLLLNRLREEDLTSLWHALTMKFLMWRLTYGVGGLFYFRFFESPKLVTISYPFFYLMLNGILSFISLIFQNSIFLYFNEFAIFIRFLNERRTHIWEMVWYHLAMCVVYLTLTIIIEHFYLRYNYYNSLSPEQYHQVIPGGRRSPLDPVRQEEQPIQMDGTANLNVSKERDSTLREGHKKIKILNLSKSYTKHVRVLKGVTFNVPESCNFGLVGPNGAGKSTLFNIILGKTLKNDGDLIVSNSSNFRNFFQMFWKPSPYAGNNFGVAFQTETIWDDLTVDENISFYARLHGVDQTALDKLLIYFDFEHYKEKTAKELSSGNKRKLCILASLMISPNILLYDEATTGVDLAMRMKLRKLFEYLREKNKLSSIFTTHFLKDIEIFCDKVGIIADGEFLFVDFIDNIKQELGGYSIDVTMQNFDPLNDMALKLKDLCQLRLVEKIDEEKRVVLKATQIKDVFEVFLYFYDLEQQGVIHDFSFHQLSIEDIYVGVFKNRNN